MSADNGRELPGASLVENVRFNALVVVPNALQGIFRRRRAAVAAATAADVDRWAAGLLRGMRKSYDGGPVRVRVIRDPALLLLDAQDVDRVLEGSPDPFASDPEAKRKGMSNFQPDALTITRGALWADRRRFNEAVVTDGAAHQLAEHFLAVATEEASALPGAAEEGEDRVDWDAFHSAFRRTTRRIVLGDSARDDEELSELLGELMSAANSLPSEPSEKLADFQARIGVYVEAAEEGSLVSLIPSAPATAETKPAGQVPHWMFAMQDTLAINTFRALALIASHPRQRALVEEELGAADLGSALGIGGLSYLEACLEEAMRLWPTTAMLSRETLTETEWKGAVLPAGSQILFVNVFFHRDPDTHEFAHRFAPEAWTEGDARSDPAFNHFSHGPQGCPGSGLALFVGKAVLAALLSRDEVSLESPNLDPDRPLPHMLDFFGIRFSLETPGSG